MSSRSLLLLFPGVHPELLRCLNRVFVRGCEAKYLGAVVDKPAFCDAMVDQSAASTLPNHHRRRAETTDLKPNRFESPPRALSPAPQQIAGTDSSQRAGSLVIHIRSGDIFDPTGEGSKRPEFGQVGSRPLVHACVGCFLPHALALTV